MHVSPTGLVFAIYYPVLAAIGVPANLAVIVILSRGRCGLSRCITYYLVSMAVTDLLVIITAVIFNRISGIYFPYSFLSVTLICTLRTMLNYAAVDSSVWLTVTFTFDRFMAICCQKLKIKYCTEKTAGWVIGTVCALSCLKNTFLYFIYEPLYIINNMPYFCGIKLIFYTSPAWIAYDWIHHILTPCLPFILILLLNALTVIHILTASKGRRRLRAHSNGKAHSDPEMEKRKKSIVLLFCVSGSFILLYFLDLIAFLYVRITSVTYFSGSNFNQSNFILEESAFMLQLLSSCINPFIYAGTQSKFRDELKNGMKYPCTFKVSIDRCILERSLQKLSEPRCILVAKLQPCKLKSGAKKAEKAHIIAEHVELEEEEEEDDEEGGGDYEEQKSSRSESDAVVLVRTQLETKELELKKEKGEKEKANKKKKT
ncbi:probable G-protein coupled receptor 139 [Heterodontus francisci]|uniref:probable G-protein coupled receptor 139 n=1 Tax=Heterodontus francisci TaxID=7792 RepID=UPI00355C46D8